MKNEVVFAANAAKVVAVIAFVVVTVVGLSAGGVWLFATVARPFIESHFVWGVTPVDHFEFVGVLLVFLGVVPFLLGQGIAWLVGALVIALGSISLAKIPQNLKAKIPLVMIGFGFFLVVGGVVRAPHEVQIFKLPGDQARMDAYLAKEWLLDAFCLMGGLLVATGFAMGLRALLTESRPNH
jgi:hypothetical protein